MIQKPIEQLESMKAVQNKELLENYVRAKTAKLATAEFASLNAQLQEAQQKFAKYKRKMAWLKEGSGANANSLKNEPLSKRFIYGGNLQVPTIVPFSIAIAPLFGYRLNKKISTGFRFSYKSVIGKKDLNNQSLGGEMGYSGFINYNLVNNWFGWGEFEWMRKRTSTSFIDGYTTVWQKNVYLGIGRQIGVIKNLKVTGVILCNLLQQDLNRFDINAFQFRLGVIR